MLLTFRAEEEEEEGSGKTGSILTAGLDVSGSNAAAAQIKNSLMV